MENLKKTLRGRMWLAFAAVAALLVLLALNITDVLSLPGDDHYVGFVSGFQSGVIVCLGGVLLVLGVQYRSVLKDPDMLKKAYINETDERNKRIQEKTGGTILLACAFIIFAAAIVSAYFSQVVFFSLLGCGAFLVFTKAILRFYYNRKY